MRVRLFSPITSALAAVALTATVLATATAPATADPSPPATAAAAAAPDTSATTPATGWFLSVVSAGKRDFYGVTAKSQTLELVSPAGVRKVLFASKLTRRGIGYIGLVDWSADGRTALVSVQSGPRSQRVLAIDTASGTIRALDVPKDYSVNLLSPDGTGVLVTRYGRNRTFVARLGWDGSLLQVASPYGRTIAVSPSTVLAATPGRKAQSVDVYSVVTGGTVARFNTPGLYCDPVRRWDATHIELGCYSGKAATKLLLLDTTTGALSPATPAYPKSKKFYGELDARQLDSGTYIQVSSECGVQIARPGADGRLQVLPVAKPADNVTLVTANGSDLVIQRGPTCRGKALRGVLTRYNPVTGVETPIVALADTEAFDRVLPFGEGAAAVY